MLGFLLHCYAMGNQPNCFSTQNHQVYYSFTSTKLSPPHVNLCSFHHTSATFSLTSPTPKSTITGLIIYVHLLYSIISQSHELNPPSLFIPEPSLDMCSTSYFSHLSNWSEQPPPTSETTVKIMSSQLPNIPNLPALCKNISHKINVAVAPSGAARLLIMNFAVYIDIALLSSQSVVNKVSFCDLTSEKAREV